MAHGERLGIPVPLDHPIVHWFIKAAADFLNRCQVRDAGKAHFEMEKGRTRIELMAEFGEHVCFRPLETAKETEKQRLVA